MYTAHSELILVPLLLFFFSLHRVILDHNLENWEFQVVLPAVCSD